MPHSDRVRALWKRYAKLMEGLNGLDLILQGSILKRRLKRPLPSLRGKERQYGPYYQWTRKREGRTVNVNLSPRRAAAFYKAIRENQKLEKILSRMRTLSQQILESSTPDISRRSPRRPK